MKNMKKVVCSLVAALLCLIIPARTPAGFGAMAVQAAPENGLVRENGHTRFYKNGTPVTKTWKTIAKKTYYFGSDGAALTGWQTLKKGGRYGLYWFSSKGVLNTKKTKNINQTYVNGIVKKADRLIKKAGVSDGTDEETAIRQLFDTFVRSFGYNRDRTPAKPKGWTYRYASEMFAGGKGSCYHYAAAFGYLVKRATGLPVRVCRGTGCVFAPGRWQYHAWTEVKRDGKWYVYDTNAAKYSSRRDVVFCGLEAGRMGGLLKRSKSETVIL